jgi:hypothetical protein
MYLSVRKPVPHFVSSTGLAGKFGSGHFFCFTITSGVKGIGHTQLIRSLVDEASAWTDLDGRAWAHFHFFVLHSLQRCIVPLVEVNFRHRRTCIESSAVGRSIHPSSLLLLSTLDPRSF